MKRLSNILETYWSNMNRRSQGTLTRKEDIIKSNVKDMVPVDLGLSVLWADRDLEIDGKTEFTIDKVEDYEPAGWRRPTREEADELFKNCKKWTSNKNQMAPRLRMDTYQVTFHNNGNELVFNCRFGKYNEFFERENTEQEGYWSSFEFREDGSFLPHSVYSMVKLNEPARVRFVKDK